MLQNSASGCSSPISSLNEVAFSSSGPAHQRPEHDIEHCCLRRAAIDDCSKARFILTLVDYYFLKRFANQQEPYGNPQEKCKCPMLRCLIEFSNAYEMIEHVKVCNQFPLGEAWCLSCDVSATFPTHCRGHALSKRDTLTQKFMKPIDSIKEVGRKISGRKSPTPSASRFLPPSAAVLGLPKHHEPFHERDLSTPTTGRDSPQFELPSDDSNMAEMPADMSSSIAMLHSDETPSHIADHWCPEFADRARAIPNTPALSLKSSHISSEGRFSSPADQSVLNAGPTRMSSLDTVQSDDNCPSLDVSLASGFGTISSCSTACESDGQLHTSSNSGSTDTILDVLMTSSPVETIIEEELWPPTQPNPSYHDAVSIDPMLLLTWDKDTNDSAMANPSQHGHMLDPTSISLQTMPVPSVAEMAFHTASSHPIKTRQIRRKPVSGQVLGVTGIVTAYPNEAMVSSELRSTVTSHGVVKDCAVLVPIDMHLSPDLTTPDLTTNEKGLSCEYLGCDYAYGHSIEERRNYSRHWKRNHTPPRIFECPVPLCGKTFRNRKDNLLKHQRLAHGMVTKPKGGIVFQGVQRRTLNRPLNRHARTGYHAGSLQNLRP